MQDIKVEGLSSTGRLCVVLLGMLEGALHSLHVGNLPREDLLDVDPFLHVLLILDPLHHGNHQFLKFLLLLGHVLRGLHRFDHVDPDVNLFQRLVKGSLSTSPVVHVSQSNTMPVVGLGNRSKSKSVKNNDIREIPTWTQKEEMQSFWRDNP